MRYLQQCLQRNLEVHTNSGASNPGVQEFMNNFNLPVRPAVDTPKPAEQATPGMIPAGDGYFRVKEEPKPEQAAEPKPVFTDEVVSEEQKPKADTVKGVSLETFLKVRNMLQSQLLGMIGQNPAEKYKLSESDLDLLAEAYAPYADAITGMLPPWVMLLLIETVTTGKLIMMAVNDRRHALSNKKAAQGRVAPGASTTQVPQKARSRFQIHPDGRFTYDRLNTYVKVTDLTGEKPDLSNREEMKEVIFRNGWTKVRDAFGLADTWAKDNGYEIEED